MPKSVVSEAEVQRQETDESLDTERTSTDAALQERAEEQRRSETRSTREERARTDARTKTARARNDHLGPTGQGGESKAARATADAALHDERTRSDELKRQDGSRLEEIVFRLFAKEREETDRHLQAEREGLDHLTSLRLRYLAMLGHDLRDLLHRIGLTAMVVSQPGAETNKVIEGGKRIERLGRRMERLVTDLVDTSTLDSGALKVVVHAADFGRAVKEVIESLQPEADARGIKLECKVAKSLASVFDHERILQVLGNVVGNAIRFTPPGGRVTVQAARVEGILRATVEDTGPGIPADMRETVFEPFRKLLPEARDDRGLGLGLHIARSIVEAHGGEIWVEEATSGGCRLIFTLPPRRG